MKIKIVAVVIISKVCDKEKFSLLGGAGCNEPAKWFILRAN
jgi:hypothetical protein